MTYVVYVMLAATVVLLVIILSRLARQKQASALDQALPTILDSLKNMSAVQSQVTTLANANSLIMQNLNKLEVALKGFEGKFAESTGDVKQAISKDVGDARRVLIELKTRFEDQTKRDDDIHMITRRIERVVVGARSRGTSGENILAEAFSQFPPEMIDKDFRVGGRVVEYAIVLPNKKRLPVDSKWSGVEILERIEAETDPVRIKRLEDEVEKAIRTKVKEVASYIDPTCTTTIAIAAVPDSIYGFCRKGHIDAFKLGVLLMAYSMVVPYVLALYHLHLQFARSIDFENVEAYITKIERSLDEVDKILENRVAKAGAMAASAYSDCKTLLGSMRAATTFLRELPEEGGPRAAAAPGSVPGALEEGPGNREPARERTPEDGGSLPLIS
ncbi:MAG TPA: DNA recombination protein RmuC [bacterium]|nr:DNA recombination protein RmuC [bacterium]